MLSIQKLRNPHVMKWGLYMIIGLTIPAFVLFYGFSPNQPVDQLQGTLVTVKTNDGEVKLERRDLVNAERAAGEYYTSFITQNISPRQRMQIAQTISRALSAKEKADFAVSEVALAQRLREQDLRPTVAQVEMKLAESNMTQEQLRNYLDQTGMSEAEFIASERRAIRNELAIRTIQKVSKTSLLEIWDQYRLQNEEFVTKYFNMPMPSLGDIEVTEEEVQVEYDELTESRSPMVIDREKRIYEFVSLPSPRLPAPTVTEEELMTLYSEAEDDAELWDEGGMTVQHVLVSVSPQAAEEDKASAREEAEAARQRIIDGEDFAAVANEVSDDIRNQSFNDVGTTPTLRGGILPSSIVGTEVDVWGDQWISYANEADLNEISEVIETPLGYSVMQVIERNEPGKKEFEEVRSILESRVKNQKRSGQEEERLEIIANNIGKLREASATRTTMEGIAQDLGTDVKTTSPTLSTSAYIQGLGNLGQEREALEFLKPQEVSPVLQTSDGTVAVVKIVEVYPERIKSLEEVRSIVENREKRQKAVEMRLEEAEEVKTLMANGDSFTSAALTMDYIVESPDPFTRNSIPTALQTSQDLIQDLVIAQEGDVIINRSGTADFATGVVVLFVEEINQPEISEFVKGMRDIEQSLLRMKQRAFVEEFRRDSLASLEAEFNPVLLPSEDER